MSSAGITRRLQNLSSRVAGRVTRTARKAQVALAKRRWQKQLPALPRGSDGRLMLHLGCGDINAYGFVNVDARPLPHVHLVTRELFKLHVIPDQSVDLIYMCHVLEHVRHREVHATLTEMRRMLKTGGTLRISVPDFDKMLEIYRVTGSDVLSIEQPMMGGQDYDFNFHYCLFNRQRLTNSLEAAGFNDVRSWDPKNCDNHGFDDWANLQHGYKGQAFEISLNLEGTAS